MIVLDLEWNSGRDKRPIDEILQIGAVRMKELGGPILDTFSVHIRPKLHRSFSPAAKRLPELQLSRESQLDFPAAYAAFRQWCGDETVFAQWGGDDFKTLRSNCEHWDLPVMEPEKTYDFQWAFSAMLDEDRQVRLCDAVEYLQIPASFCFHNALHDALYTALVGAWMGEARALVEKPPKRKKYSKYWNFTPLEFPPQSRRRVGPFQNAETVLNAKNSRKPLCPLCQNKCLIQSWYFSEPQVYYGPFRCAAHGDFLCRLTVTALEDGTWRGRLAVPPATPALLSLFDKAYSSNRHLCRSAGKPGRKRRRRRGRSRRGISAEA